MTREEKTELIELSSLNNTENVNLICDEAQGIAISLNSDIYAPTLCKLERAYICGRRKSEKQLAELEAGKPKWHRVFIDCEPYSYEYWDIPQENLPKIQNFFFVKLKNGFIKICELKYDSWNKKKYFYDLHGGKQSDVAEWLDYPTV